MQEKQVLAKEIADFLAKQYQLELTADEILSKIEKPKDEKMGDLAFPCFILAKALKKGPPVIAKELSEGLQVDPQVFSACIATGPYLNFTLNKADLASKLIPSILSGEFIEARPSKSEKVMIEHSQPNTHKGFHVGHTRNTALGDALVRMYRWAGYEVISATYPGDVGTHIAKCLWYFTQFTDQSAPETHKGEFLGECYTHAERELTFHRLSWFPHAKWVAAKVVSKTLLKKETNLHKVEIQTAKETKTLVCGGTNYNEGDLVVYAPPGSYVKGRLVQSTEKHGVASEGMILSEKEATDRGSKDDILKLNSDDLARVFQWDEPITPNTPLQAGSLLVEAYNRQPDDYPSALEEIQRRKTGVEKMLKDIEAGEPAAKELWLKTRQWSLDEFESIFNWLDVKFDEYFFESEVSDEGKEIVKQAHKDGILVESEGAIGADLSDYKMPFFILLKSNGTGLYSTKDIALAKRKFDEFKIDRSVYVVDVSQSLHFQQTFKTLELLGFKQAKKCYHMAYNMVEGTEGKFSSRLGNAPLFSELRAKLVGQIREDFLDKYIKEDGWSDQQVEDTARAIAVATIRYGMLNQDNNKKIRFDMTEWTARTGNTGPYIMYAYARTRSILREAGIDTNNEAQYFDQLIQQTDWSQLRDPSEEKLLRQMKDFPEVAANAAENFSPQALCIYLYQLSKDFNVFYTNCPVIKANDESTKKARLALIKAYSLVIQKGLSLLGISTVEKM